MRVSVDTSFVFAVLKKELRPEAHERAKLALEHAESVHVPIVVCEEILRSVVPRSESERVRSVEHVAAITTFLLFAETPPLTRQTAGDLARLWAEGREKGAKSTTIDTFAARESLHAGCVMLTCDAAQRDYLERGFGKDRVSFFEISDPADSPR